MALRKDVATYINDDEIYSHVFKERNVPRIEQYPTPRYKEITLEMASKVEQIRHIWSLGDRYYKLAHKYYNDTNYWWVIARFNRKPTEAHLKIGDTISIPMPLSQALLITTL